MIGIFSLTGEIPDPCNKESFDNDVVTINKEDIARETDEEDCSMQNSSGQETETDGCLQEGSVQKMDTETFFL